MDKKVDYARLCSQQTLQDKTQGFFRDLVEQVSPCIDLSALENCRTDMDRIRYCASVCWNAVRAEMVFKGKNEQESKEKRLEGNQAFERGDLKRALLYYCQSIIRGPPGPELAYVYSNRSTLFEKMGDYQNAINDAETAISYGYPENNRHKVYERMTACYIALENFPKAKVTLRLASHLAAQNLADDKFLKKMDKLKEKIENHGIKAAKETKTPCSSPLPDDRKSFEASSKFPSASAKFGVEYEDSQGRYAVATETIKTGEIILREQPYASSLMPERMGTHCLHCFARLTAPVACETCANVAFCQRQCRSDADKYHRYECRILALLIGAGMSVLSHLALRIVTQSTAGDLIRKISRLQSEPSQVAFNAEGRFESSYENLYNLVALEGERPVEDFRDRCIMTLFLMKCLRLVGYFEEFQLNIFKNPKPTEQELIIGSIILRNLQVLQFNAYEISEFWMESRRNFRNTKSYNLGVGIYNTGSFFNHSCAPNITRNFESTTMIVESIQKIKKGQSISDNYGPYFTKITSEDRQYRLKGRYWFDCACLACKENWPCLNEFPMELEGRNKAENQILARLQKLDKTYFDKAVQIMQTGNAIVASEYLKKYLDECGTLIQDLKGMNKDECNKDGKIRQFFYKTFYLAQEALKLCLSSDGSVYLTESNK
ncbi:unnamed protein product [Allacma fusca]|uniref:SET domain-containing protein n=1 Tax=Allacma fusca TaxID=39272 RepID=A0A8J2Q6M9_9HEXA|nr:unnamed protein product [Allacma fusca]